MCKCGILTLAFFFSGVLPRFSAIFKKPYNKGSEAEVELKIEMWFQLDFSGSRTEIDIVSELESQLLLCMAD